MAAEIISEDPFGAESISTAKALIEEVYDNLPRMQGTDGLLVGDAQTQRILRVLRILTQQVEYLRNAGRDDTAGE